MNIQQISERPPKAPKTFSAALYIRLSREDGDKPESDSVVNQKRILEGFAASQPDIGIADIYIDDGFSGASFDRPAFTRMMADAYSGRINCVIVKDSSRFGRNVSESGRYIGEVFPRLGVRYIAVNDLIDSGKSNGAAVDFLNNTMRGMINEYYVAANSESIRSTLNMERRRGEFIGSFAKYGYKKDPADRHRLVIDEEAAQTVRAIFGMYLSGLGIRGIVRSLNESGVLSPAAYKQSKGLNFKPRGVGGSVLWSDKTVRRTLQDEMYIGTMVQGKCRKISYKSKATLDCPPGEWIRVEGTHEAIIGKEDFDRVQDMLQRGVKGSPDSGKVDLFAGLLKCADCGRAMIRKTNRNPGKTYVYYKCSTYGKCRSACSPHTVRSERLYNCVLYCIQQMVDAAVNADRVLSEAAKNRPSRPEEKLSEQLKALKSESERIKNLTADLYPDYKSGLLNKDQYLINKRNFELTLDKIEQNIKRLKESAGSSCGISNSTDEFIRHFRDRGNIDSLTRPLLTELVDRIEIHSDGTVDITFNFTDALAEAMEPIG